MPQASISVFCFYICNVDLMRNLGMPPTEYEEYLFTGVLSHLKKGAEKH